MCQFSTSWGTGGRLNPTIVSDLGERYRVNDQASFSRAVGAWPLAECLFLDACNTWRWGWHRAVAACIPCGSELLYVGTTRSVTWGEATLFTGNFYSALLRSQMSGDVNED